MTDYLSNRNDGPPPPPPPPFAQPYYLPPPPWQPPMRPPVSMSNSVSIRGGRGRTPHILHFLLTCLTCGLWLPVWIIDAIRR
jgi:hypothetical protein